MALSQSAVSDLLDAFRAGDGVDLIRESVRLVLQELIEVEATEMIGAAPYERTETRTNERNGSRPRLLATQAGDVELAIPKLRKGSFFPSILEPRRRIDQALYAVVMEAYVAGVSTRSVDDLVAALGIASGISKSEVSRICAGLDEIVGAFRTRQLDHVEFPYIYLDATYLHVRNQTSQVTSMAVVVATGITAEGNREILGCDIGDSEDETFWRGFLRSLKARGLTGVKLVISDQHAGLVAALTKSFQGASHQRCRVHFARNLLALVPKSHTDMVAALFRTIFAQPNADAVSSTWDQVRDQLASMFPKIGPLMDNAKAEVLAFTAFPRAHWQKIWSTNPLERINKEIKRRSRVVGIFPNEASVIRLVGAVLADMHDEWQASDRRYLSDGSMAKLYPERDTGVIAELNTGD
jgi:putative transposase